MSKRDREDEHSHHRGYTGGRAKLTSLVAEYMVAQSDVLVLERRIRRLAREGDHKRKNKIITTELAKATLARNQAQSALMAMIDADTQEYVNERLPESWTDGV